jgi:uncharacterized membrane protein YoaK (UPF0700 family)
VVAVFVIALVDAILMGLGNHAYEITTGNYSIISWPDSFWLLFEYTLIFALAAGAVLAPIFYSLGRKLPEPKLLWLLLIGVVIGPLPIAALDARLPEATTIVSFSLLGFVSAAIWWLLVEASRSAEA